MLPVDTHTLPGLCHSAAVAAAALRAPAQPQLLLRLTPIKVVCEFSETRHLSCDCSPAVLEAFLYFNLLGEKNPILLVWLCQAPKQALDFYQGLVLSASPSLLMSLHSFDALPLLCRRTIPATFCFFSSGFFWSACAARKMHTHLRAHWLSQNSNAWNCLPIHTAVEDPHPRTLTGEQEEKRVTERWQLSISPFLCWRVQSWWENMSCYPSPPTPSLSVYVCDF